MTVFDLATTHFHISLQLDPGTLMVLIQVAFPILKRAQTFGKVRLRPDNPSLYI